MGTDEVKLAHEPLDSFPVKNSVIVLFQRHFNRPRPLQEAFSMKGLLDQGTRLLVGLDAGKSLVSAFQVLVVPRMRHIKQLAEVARQAFETLLYGVVDEFETLTFA
jgi:hypothetical protein